MKKILLTTTMLGALAGFTTAAQATTIEPDVVFDLTSCHLEGGCGTATQFGTVALTQTTATTVKIDVVLNDGNLFIETGAGAQQLFLFNDTISGSLVTGITTTLAGNLVSIPGGVTGVTNVVDPQTGDPTLHADGTGFFSAGIHCTLTGNLSPCNGASGANIDDLHFTVTGVTIADLTTANLAGNLFVADILCGQPGCTNLTGPIDVSQVPGPVVGALGLPGLISACFGMFGLNYWRRRRQVA
jgi:hypothetical protein